MCKKKNPAHSFISGKIYMFETENWTLETGPGHDCA